MKLLTKLRARRQSWGGRTLGLFVLVWLNFALQPCVMAFESDHEGDCPHCPPAIAERHDGHAMHDMEAMHDMAEMQMPCADSPECGDLDDFNYDGRTGEIKLDKPVDHVIALIPIELTQPLPTASLLVRRAPSREHRSGASPPLHVLNCVYLD